MWRPRCSSVARRRYQCCRKGESAACETEGPRPRTARPLGLSHRAAGSTRPIYETASSSVAPTAVAGAAPICRQTRNRPRWPLRPPPATLILVVLFSPAAMRGAGRLRDGGPDRGSARAPGRAHRCGRGAAVLDGGGLADYGALGTATSSAKRLKIGGKGLDGVIEKVKFYLQDFWQELRSDCVTIPSRFRS